MSKFVIDRVKYQQSIIIETHPRVILRLLDRPKQYFPMVMFILLYVEGFYSQLQAVILEQI